MPYVNFKLTPDGLTPEKKRILIKEVTELLQRELGKNPDTTIVSASDLADAVAERTGGQVAAPGSPEATADYLAERVVPGDIVLAMGGGRSYVIAERLMALLGAADAE